MSELDVRTFCARAFRARLAITLMNELHHLVERCAGEKDFVHAFAAHHRGVLVRDCAAAAAEHLDVGRAFLAQKSDYFREKLDVTTVVTGDTDRANVFLDRRTHDVANGSMISQINDLDPVPDELEIDRVDRAVMPIANRDGGQNSDR
jgi:hypothetical protein